jgi:hypothetical protein
VGSPTYFIIIGGYMQKYRIKQKDNKEYFAEYYYETNGEFGSSVSWIPITNGSFWKDSVSRYSNTYTPIVVICCASVKECEELIYKFHKLWNKVTPKTKLIKEISL